MFCMKIQALISMGFVTPYSCKLPGKCENHNSPFSLKSDGMNNFWFLLSQIPQM